jgi:hypothetical protein
MFFYQCIGLVCRLWLKGERGEGGHWRRYQFSIKGSRLKRMGPQHKSEQKQDSVPWGSKPRHVFHNNTYMLRLWRPESASRSEEKSARSRSRSRSYITAFGRFLWRENFVLGRREEEDEHEIYEVSISNYCIICK